MNNSTYNAWPELPYAKFKPTAHLLHMCLQVMGKLKLLTPFEPHWSNVSLALNSRGLTTGLIPYGDKCFAVDLDLIEPTIICTTTQGERNQFSLGEMSVATLTEKLLTSLKSLGITTSINPKPQEVPQAIAFLEDTQKCQFDESLANAWFQILVSSYRAMLAFHARFGGATPSVALMWGTMDLRDVRYIHQKVPTTGANSGYIRRNAMDVAQFELGFWHGNEIYKKPAYYSFIYPPVENITEMNINPPAARWDKTLGEFILDYEDVRQSSHPEEDLIEFFESSYQALSEQAKWDKTLIYPGIPV